ncbi:MAG: ester cyclase [Coleofasciculaceae cyanobacterium SM2_1_6]|nr:ester cyclase [Coleofasciculaceae cyanobacterium SM2_1_6]
METNQQIVTRFIEDFLGKADLVAADATAHPNIQGYTGLKPMGAIDGLEEYKQIILSFVAAFPAESPVHIVDQFSSTDGTRVVTRFQSRQRHAQDYYGIAATNRLILFDETHVARIEDGKIIENIVSATNLEFEMLMAPVLTPMILK